MWLTALPWFLVLCRSSSENIRESSLIFLKLLNAFLVDTSPLKNIIKRLLKSKNEIINDGR